MRVWRRPSKLHEQWHFVDNVGSRVSTSPKTAGSFDPAIQNSSALERMRLGWGRDDGPLFFSCPGRSAARVLRAGADSTLHGVVFAIFCPGPTVHRPTSA